MTPVFQKLKEIFARPFAFPLVLLAVCILAYGVLIPWLGFYWDDWIWIWIGHSQGRSALLGIDQAHRPLSGAILWLGALFAGENPFGWQFFTLAARWLAGVAAWWMLNQLWPPGKARNAAIAFLICVYPGYGHQFVAVNSSRHVFPMAAFFLSLGMMVKANRKPERKRLFTVLSLLSGVLGMLSSEYFYGLELLRPLILWLALTDQEQAPRQRLWKSLRTWLPYLGMLAAVFLWRYTVSQTTNYRISLLAEISAHPWETIAQTVAHIFSDIYEAGILVWLKIFAIPDPDIFGPRKTLLLATLAITGAALVFGILAAVPRKTHRQVGQMALLGGAALFVGGLSAWVTGLDIKLAFPGDRLTLPLAFGSSLLVAALLETLAHQRTLWALLAAAIVGLAIGADFQTAVAYQRDWQMQADFFHQLSWRVPDLKPNTAILSVELPFTHDKDDSLSAPLNWIYDPNATTEQLRYHILYLDLRLGTSIPTLAKGVAIDYDTHALNFSGSTDQVVVLYYDPPRCLRILHPIYDAQFPQLPELLQEALPLANLDQIIVTSATTAHPPEQLFGKTPEPNWCYYLQNADLARQRGDWEEVARIAEIAFQLDNSPNHASELVPYIQGYAYTGQYDQALALTTRAIKTNKFMAPMLCDIWRDIAANAPASAAQRNAIQEVADSLSCRIP